MTRLTLICSCILSSYWLLPNKAIAQVTSDNTLSTTVDSADGTDFVIENGDRAGNNLFHSFQDFSVPEGGSATFDNATDIVNIFSRVTGGNISDIQGAINANGSANLLLINPAGIVFGENASLNIGGSFFATTADSLLFEGGEFSAVNPQATPLLTVNRPIGLNFGDNPGSIINQAGQLTDPVAPPPGLQVQPGQNITLVGGEIQLDGGFLTASGGKIELGSVAEATQVNFVSSDSDEVLEYETEINFGDIRLSDLSRVDVGGLGDGEVRLQGKNIVLTGGAKINSDTFADFSGGDISINATDSLQILGTTDRPNLFEPNEARLKIFIPVRSSITSSSFSEGDAGDIVIDTQRLILNNGGQITAATISSVITNDSVSDPGEGGNITIKAEDIAIVGVSALETEEVDLFGLGRLGIEVNASSAIGTVTGNAARAGNLTIDTKKLAVVNGGIITTNSFAEGAGGDLIINSTESVDVEGRSPNQVVLSTIVSATVTAGEAGDIRINTERLRVQKGGEVNARSFNAGRAGNLNIDARNVLLDNGTLIATTQAGDRGNINVNNAETILLRNNAQITTNATELSTGGDINLDAEAIAVFNNSNITAIAETGQGGNIQITTQGLFIEPNSEITAASELGIDGTITFNTPDVDPTAGIVELPSVLIDAESILAQDLCRVENENVAGGSSFIITGRGGLTPTSAESLSNLNRVVEWTDVAELEVSDDGRVAVGRSPIQRVKQPNYRQSQGLMVADDGSLWLSADAYKTIPQNSTIVHPDCNHR